MILKRREKGGKSSVSLVNAMGSPSYLSPAFISCSTTGITTRTRQSLSSSSRCYHHHHHHHYRKSSFVFNSLPLRPTSSPHPHEHEKHHNKKISATVANGNAEESEPQLDDESDQKEEENIEERPDWAPSWLPQFLITNRKKPLFQLAILLPLYTIHLFLFSTKGFKFKHALLPNNKNLFQSIGYDSIAGAVVAVVFLVWRQWWSIRRIKLQLSTSKSTSISTSTSTSTETSSETETETGTEIEIETEKKTGTIGGLLRVDNPPWYVPREAKRKIGQTTLLLFVAYLASGYGAVFSEQILYLLAGSGVPLTVATTRAWKVLLGHLMWVYMGIGILRRLKPFFPKKGTWLKWKWKSNWLWWAIGGYYVSALFFNIADVFNQSVLPSSLFDEETVVSKLINPENKDRIAMAVGSIGPCVSAPVFEEVLYRGFLLPALACFLPMWAAVPASSVLFAIHHLNPTMIIPLSMLGFIWALLYAKSGNLTVTILIHAMWNSRVFLGSLLGLGPFTDFE